MADASRYSATFDMPGYQVAGPWLALGIALVALGLVMAPLRRRIRAVTTTLIGVSAVAWYVAATTPLRTLHSFIPSEIQVDYGTEFARIVFEGGPSVAAAAAVVAALTSVAVTWVARSAVSTQTETGEDAAQPHVS